MIFSFETQNILYVYVLLGIAFVLTVVCAVVLWRRAHRLSKFDLAEATRDYLPKKRFRACRWWCMPTTTARTWSVFCHSCSIRIIPILMWWWLMMPRSTAPTTC